MRDPIFIDNHLSAKIEPIKLFPAVYIFENFTEMKAYIFFTTYLQVWQSWHQCAKDCSPHSVGKGQPVRGGLAFGAMHRENGWEASQLATHVDNERNRLRIRNQYSSLVTRMPRATCIYEQIFLKIAFVINLFTLSAGDCLFPPNPPAPMMKTENWLMATNSPRSVFVSARKICGSEFM